MLYVIGLVGIILLAMMGIIGFEHERVLMETHRADAAELQLKAAKEEAQAWYARWSAQVDYADAQKKTEDQQREQTFKELESRAKVGGKCVAPTDISKLLGDITRAANAARLAGVDQSSASTVPGPAKK